MRHAGWREVVDGMVAAGIIGREKDGVLQATRHPVVDTAAHESLLEHVRATAVGSGPIDPETAGLLALAGPSQQLEVVAPRRQDRAAAKRRISESAESVPAAAAVKYAVDAASGAGVVA